MGDIEAFPNNERNLPGIFDFTWYIPTIRSRCVIIENEDSIAVTLKDILYTNRTNDEYLSFRKRYHSDAGLGKFPTI